VKRQAKGDCDLLVLPETCLTRGGGRDAREQSRAFTEHILPSLSDLAKSLNTPVIAPILRPLPANRAPTVLPTFTKDSPYIHKAEPKELLLNTQLVIHSDGSLCAAYDKIHMFELISTGPGGHSVRERDTYEPGDHLTAVKLKGWNIGLTTCYDVRFTGRDHWHTLLKARAIENQAYVLAPNLAGDNARSGLGSYGHTLAVDPWGSVVSDLGTMPEGVGMVTLKREEMDKARQKLQSVRDITLIDKAKPPGSGAPYPLFTADLH
ncbi:hypothetical protein KIPB_005823, partial [Kipferlia bialata]